MVVVVVVMMLMTVVNYIITLASNIASTVSIYVG